MIRKAPFFCQKIERSSHERISFGDYSVGDRFDRSDVYSYATFSLMNASLHEKREEATLAKKL